MLTAYITTVTILLICDSQIHNDPDVPEIFVVSLPDFVLIYWTSYVYWLVLTVVFGISTCYH